MTKRGIGDSHILLVEDNEINQLVMEEILRSLQLTTDIAEHGEKALECLKRRRYDAVLMDAQMPDYQATRERRAQPQFACLPVCLFACLPIVAMTAHAMSGDKEKCLAAGMNDYLTKPVDDKILYSTLLKWISPRNSADEKDHPSDSPT